MIRRQSFKKMLEDARALHVKIAAGFDAGSMEAQGKNANELVALVRFGFSPQEAIRAATLSGAELADTADSVGSLTPGKFADMIAVKGDPLNDIAVLREIVFVMKGGIVIHQ